MKTIELAIKAGRQRQSPVTQFIHHCTEQPEHALETIPVFENFCFVLALFRTKTSEHVLEGRALLEKLFAFQTAEGFPLYLHEYPQCRSRKLAQKLALIAHFLLRDFSSVLGELSRTRLQALLIPLASMASNTEPSSPEEWADFLVQSQITETDPAPAFQLWDPKALCFTGAQKQEGIEPEVTLFDLILGEWMGNYSERALRDHPVHLQASLIYPDTALMNFNSEKKWEQRFWGLTHSSLLHTVGIAMEKENVVLIDLPAKEVNDEMEITYFLNRHPGLSVSLNGITSTSFQLGEPIKVISGAQTFEVVFSLIEGKGRFWGHIYFGNRPGQIGCKGSLKYEAFDWQIALRTIERKERCLIQIDFRLLSENLCMIGSNQKSM